MMTVRENFNAMLHYRNFDKVPVMHFRFWKETLEKWLDEGKITQEECNQSACGKKLGFDFGWEESNYYYEGGLCPVFETKVLEKDENGYVVMQNAAGLIERHKEGVPSIPSTVGTLLKDRKAWEELYLPKLQAREDRVNVNWINENKDRISARENCLVGVYAGSMYGRIRDMLGIENLAYLQADDEDLYIEIIDTVGNLSYENAKRFISTGAKIDYIHMWEDICFKNGPLVNPEIFEKYVCPHYKKITDLYRENGVDICSLDCDGCIDELVPLWVKSGVNTMFPIEVGTWDGNIKRWRDLYGKEVRGIGGFDKRVFAMDYKAVDREIERIRPFIDLGGYVPCPDHLIAPDAIYENVQYYVDRMQNLRV